MSNRKLPQLAWLASFVGVVEHSTFTAAARALRLSQPRISAHVAALEKELGTPLLERAAHGVRLTAAGETFLPYARTVLRELRNGAEAVTAVTTALQGRIRIGSYPGAMAVVIAPLVRRFSTAHPGVVLELLEDDPAVLEQAVADREIDIAVRTADVPQRHHHIPSTPLFHEKVVLVVRPDHPLARHKSAEPRLLAHETVIVSGDPRHGWADYRDRLDRVGVEPQHLITVVQPTTLVALVREGVGVGLLGALAAHITIVDDEVTTRALPTLLWQREIRVYRLADDDTPPNPAVDAFLDLLIREAPALTVGTTIWPS